MLALHGNSRVMPFGFFKRVDGKIARQLNDRNTAIKNLNAMMSLKGLEGE
ncbi:hypothetical protein [Bradyrhizobium pachyrhizi]|nr:hypothetical protein [Bradyrhizobium pachyrhizi]